MKNKKIVIVDYGVGNLASLVNLLSNLDLEIVISKNRKTLNSATFLLLPGVGNFGEAISNLKKNNIFFFLKKLIKMGKPTIGICLGMQILFQSSEESLNENGLSVIDGKISKLKKKNIGWCKIFSEKKNEFKKFDNDFFYFNHSYGYVGNKNFCKSYIKDLYPCSAIIKKKNILGIQFHPEKSQNEGQNFFLNLFDKENLQKLYK